MFRNMRGRRKSRLAKKSGVWGKPASSTYGGMTNERKVRRTEITFENGDNNGLPVANVDSHSVAWRMVRSVALYRAGPFAACPVVHLGFLQPAVSRFPDSQLFPPAQFHICLSVYLLSRYGCTLWLLLSVASVGQEFRVGVAYLKLRSPVSDVDVSRSFLETKRVGLWPSWSRISPAQC